MHFILPTGNGNILVGPVNLNAIIVAIRMTDYYECVAISEALFSVRARDYTSLPRQV